MENKILKHYGVLFNKKSGKIVTTLESLGCGLLSLYALNHATKTRDFVIFTEEGSIVKYYEGVGNGNCPKTWKEVEGKHIDTLCKGLLQEVSK